MAEGNRNLGVGVMPGVLQVARFLVEAFLCKDKSKSFGLFFVARRRKKHILEPEVAVNCSVGSNDWLVVWNILYFSIQLGIILPIDELTFFRGVGFYHQPDHR